MKTNERSQDIRITDNVIVRLVGDYCGAWGDTSITRTATRIIERWCALNPLTEKEKNHGRTGSTQGEVLPDVREPETAS